MKAQEKTNTGAVPGVAVLLTWILPGAGHVYLGRIGFALGALLVVEGLYVLGLLLTQGMFLEYLPPEMRGRMAGMLTPEFGNLGALLYHIQEFGYGPGYKEGLGYPRAWPATMDLGTNLTAMSGVLNLLLMSHAHREARQAANDVASKSGVRAHGAPWAALASWALPGLGQFLQGRRLRGVITFVLLVSLFMIGCVLAEGSNLDRERHFYYWSGQFLLGAPAALAEFLHGHAPVTGDVPYADGGVVLGCIAGMLNILSMLDAYGAAAVSRSSTATSSAADGIGASA